jgi:hypothetical protein
LTLNLGDAGNDVNIDFSVDGQSTATVLGLNSGSALVNGSTSLDLDMDAGGFVEDTETSETLAFDIAGSIDLSALVDDLMIPIDIEGEPGCPESGLVQAGLGVNLNVLFGDESGQAEGDWSISIEMLGQGVGHVEIQSGDFLIEGTTVVCDPLLPPIRR